ncbi:MAG: hypothetical protein WEA84_00820 [Rhodovibrionaceae bacterium]
MARTARIAEPKNAFQVRWNELCDVGGGTSGGPRRPDVQELLYEASLELNEYAKEEIQAQFEIFSDRNPWHICFAFGLGWGHLAKIERPFTDAATQFLQDFDEEALKLARSYCWYRGPKPLEESLKGAYTLFEKRRLPSEIPEAMDQLAKCQKRWLTPILSRERPRYIGAWNATAMFMMALFANPKLAQELTTPEIYLPIGQPVERGLDLLHAAKIVPKPEPVGDTEGEALDLLPIAQSNNLFAEVLKGREGWNLLDVHTGLYVLGTPQGYSV